MRTASILLLVSLALLACSGNTAGAQPAASPAPSTPQPSSSPSPSSPPLAALVDFPNGTGAQSAGYDLSLVGTDGKVVAHAHAAARSFISAGGSGGGPAALDLPEVSAANGRVYYLDGDQFVRYLAPDGSTGTVAELPGTNTAHAAFAVSDDGKQIAASVLTYQGGSVTTSLFIDNVGGGGHHELLHASSELVWPVAWHGGNIVVAVNSAAFSQQGLTLNPSFATGYQTIDTSTSKSTAAIGGPDPTSGCVVTGLLVPAGTACYHGTAPSGGAGEVWTLSWSGAHSGTIGVQRLSVAALHPSQGSMAICCDDAGAVGISHGQGAAATATALKGASDSWPCWVDDQHVLVGSVNDHQFTPSILDAGSGKVTAAGAHGYCAAVLGAAGASGEPNV